MTEMQKTTQKIGLIVLGLLVAVVAIDACF